MEDIISDLRAFASEARKLADSFSDVGQDDNSYDASGLGFDAMEWIANLNEGVCLPDDAVTWLNEARGRLDNIN